jgi:hypothetical protein
MYRTTAWVMVAALLATTIAPRSATARKQKPASGVFGTINGKAFKATNRLGAGDYCMNGIYDRASGIVTFVALECRAKRRRQGATKKNFKILVMACSNYDQTRDPTVLPIELPCPSSVYEENKTGRFGIPVSRTQWGANFDFTDPANPTSNVRMRLESFDGTSVRGAIFGVFDQPIQGDASSTPAAISGEVRFDFPIVVQ